MNPNTQVLFKGTRILTTAQIANLSEGSFRGYTKMVRAMRGKYHRMNKRVCCELCNEVIGEWGPASPDQIKGIRIFDRLYYDLVRERAKRNSV